MKNWFQKDIDHLKKIYATTENKVIADYFGVTISSIKNKAHSLNLKKKNNKGEFKKGTIPPNKGKKQTEYMTPEAIEKTKATRFKKGNIPQNYKDIGSLRIDKNGYFVIKTADPSKWELLHRVIWQEHNPNNEIGNNIIVFIDGNSNNISPSNLEKITRKEAMKRTRNTDEFIAKLIEFDKEKRKEILKHPELIELKRKLLKLKRLQNEQA